MNQLFSLDNPVMHFLTKICNLIVLNFIFLLSCIPIITIGASLSSLYYVSLKIARNEDPYIWKNYWKAFRQNFKQSTLIWLIVLPVCLLLIVDFWFLRMQTASFFSYLQLALGIVTILLSSIFLYLFPIVSHFICTTKQVFKNAFFMSISHLPCTLALLFLHGFIMFLCIWSIKSLYMVVSVAEICGFSCTALLASFLFDRIFKRYEPETEQQEIEHERGGI